MKKFSAKVSIEIYASKEKVWEALTNSKIIKKYLFGTEAISDWKVGSSIIYRGVWEGKKYEDKGKILKLIPEKLLVSTYWSGFSGLPDLPENYQKVSYEIRELENGTELTITQENISTENSKEHSEKNWKIVLESLKKILEE